MATPDGPICDYCYSRLPNGECVTAFFFTQHRFCGEECLQAAFDRRRQENAAKEPRPMSLVKRGRYWAVYDADDELVCLTVYKKGAKEVIARLMAKK